MFKILLVEDEPVSRVFLKKYISKLLNQEVDVTEVSNGQLAFDKFLKDSFSLIITDLNMPGFDGEQLIKKIRDVNSDVPIIVETGYFNDFSSFDDLNITGILKKPIKPQELQKHLAVLIRSFNLD